MIKNRRTVIIAGATALALAAGIGGVTAAQASPSVPASVPAPYPDNGTNALPIGVVYGDLANPIYVVKGRNLAGTMASYQFSTADDEPGSPGVGISLNVTLSGDTGDTVSVYQQTSSGLVLVGSGTDFTVASLPFGGNGLGFQAEVSGGTKGELFTLRLAAVPSP
jgi:hypothetical protein